MRWLSVICLGLLLAAGCGEEAKRTHTPTPPVYLANTSPDSVLANLLTAWEAMDAAGYAALLHDGFDFYWGDGSFTANWGCEEETACAERLLSGTEGREFGGVVMPGVHSIAVTLIPEGDWAPVGAGELEGGDPPAGTLRRTYALAMLVRLREAIDGSEITALAIENAAVLYCAPASAELPQEWRLWRWEDFYSAGRQAGVAAGEPGHTEQFTLSGLKFCFAPDA